MKELSFNELEKIDGGNAFDTAGKIGSAIGLVGTIGLTIACPPATILGGVAAVAGIGAPAAGLFN